MLTNGDIHTSQCMRLNQQAAWEGDTRRVDEHVALTDRHDINLNNHLPDTRHQMRALTKPHDRDGQDTDATVGSSLGDEGASRWEAQRVQQHRAIAPDDLCS